MKTPVELFDDWLYTNAMHGFDLGTRFHPIPAPYKEPFSEQIAVFNQRMAQLDRMTSPGRSIKVYSDFIDNGICQAVASIHCGVGLIGIAKGAVLLPLEMFNRMLSHPMVIKGLGNSTGERVGPQHREGMPSNHDELIELRRRAGRRTEPTIPECPIRRRFAQVCFNLSQRFIAMHEIVHILHGHVEYRARVHKATSLLQIAPHTRASAASRQDLDDQALELWADWKAAESVLGGLLTNSIIAILPDVRQRLYAWGFALYTLFRIFGLNVDPAHLAGSHPPTALRFYIMMCGACRSVANNLPGLGDDYFQVLIDAARNAEDAITYCGEERITASDLVVGDQAVQDHFDALLDHHDNVLCNELKNYSHIAFTYPSGTTLPSLP